MSVVKIDKVGIAYSKSGVDQKAYFLFEDEKLVTRELHATYQPKVYIPDDVVTLRELLRFMASYSYHYRSVKIISINNKSTAYEHRIDSTPIRQLRAEVEEFEDGVALRFFFGHLLPIIKNNNWLFAPTMMLGRPTVVYVDKETGELENVYSENRILKRLNYMCATFKQDSKFDLDDFVGHFISIEELERLDLYRKN